MRERISAAAAQYQDTPSNPKLESMDEEKRGVYRVVPDELHALEIAVRTEDGRLFRGQVLDVTIDGVGVSFESDGAPHFALGNQVTLIFSSAWLESPVEVTGDVRSRVEFGEHRHYRYSFAFDQSEKLQKRLPPGVFQLFNRRSAYRVSPDLTKPVEVTVRAPEVKAVKIPTLLKDISASGVALLLDPVVESVLGAVDVIEVSFCLPTSDNDFELLGRIRRRELARKYVLYGIEFDVQQTNFAQRRKEISAYVMHRQREELRNRQGD